MKRIIKAIIILLCSCLELGFVVSFFEKKKGWVEGHTPYGPYEKYFKRPLDFGLALFALILLWPILLIIGIAVRVNMGSPVIFTQERPGLGGEIFKIKKFRTMTDARDEEGNLLSDDKRLTRFGKFLRNTSCDELPELLNIVDGSMSIIGPRPQLVRDMVFMTDEQRKRHDVRPGLTGLAQVNGRNACTWVKKFDWDLKYINCITAKSDLKILFSTIKKVFGRGESSSEVDITDDYGDWLLKQGKVSQEMYDKLQNTARNRL